MKRFEVGAHSQEGDGGVTVSGKKGYTLSEGFNLAKAGLEEQALRGDKHRHGATRRDQVARFGRRY